MVNTVAGAFTSFRQDAVDLDSKQPDKARASRDFLRQQLQVLPGKDITVPRVTGEYVASGSFSRHTKIRPLDDIDFFVLLDKTDLVIDQSLWDSRVFYLRPLRRARSPLSQLTDARGHVSSTRVMDKFKAGMAAMPHYMSADVMRNGEAVSLKLSSYDWVFDIVPAIAHVSFWTGAVDWYLMPNGKGDWMRSDPRKDAQAATEANRRNGGLLLPIVRLVKYWNTHRLRQGLSSYYVETLCMKALDSWPRVTTLQAGVEAFFRRAPSWVWAACPDPKGFGPNLDNDIDREKKSKVAHALKQAASVAHEALRLERSGAVGPALAAWARIFGPEFPR